MYVLLSIIGAHCCDSYNLRIIGQTEILNKKSSQTIYLGRITYKSLLMETFFMTRKIKYYFQYGEI